MTIRAAIIADSRASGPVPFPPLPNAMEATITAASVVLGAGVTASHVSALYGSGVTITAISVVYTP